MLALSSPWLLMTTEGDKRDGARTARKHPRRGSGGGGGTSYPLARFSIATICVGIWAADNLRGIFDSSYTPHVAAAIPLAAAAYLFGTVVWPKKDR